MPKKFTETDLSHRLAVLDLGSLSPELLGVLAVHPAAPETLALAAVDSLHLRYTEPDEGPEPESGPALHAFDGDDWPFRKAQAQSPEASESQLRTLSRDEHPYVRRGVARNPRTPHDVLEHLLEDEDELVQAAAARNPNLPHEILQAWAESGKRPALTALASCPQLRPDQLSDLAGSRWAEVRAAVARNPQSPTGSLKSLAGSSFIEVVESAAANPATPERTLKRLARKGPASVLSELSRNPSLTSSVMGKLLSRKGSVALDALLTLARSQETPKEVLSSLASRGETSIRVAVATNRSTPPESLGMLAGSNDEAVLAATAANPSTTPDDVAAACLTLGSVSVEALSTFVVFWHATDWAPAAPAFQLLLQPEGIGPSPALAGDRTAFAIATISRAHTEPSQLCEVLLAKVDPRMLLRLADGPATDLTDPEVREEIMTNPTAWPEGVRVRIGGSCEGMDLTRAARSEDPFLRLGAAAAPGAGLLLAALARDPDPAVKRVVAKRIESALAGPNKHARRPA